MVLSVLGWRAAKAALAKLRETPTLVLWGDKDLGFTKTERLRFLKHVPAAETRLPPGAKHYIQECAPEQISEAMLPFEQAH